MNPAFDLEAYLRRVNFTGPLNATLETLGELVRHHTEAIAFENLNVLAGWPVRLDLPSLERKILRDGRGGYCFEQNLLLQAVLQHLGFQVTGLAARVVWNLSDDEAPAPLTHMLLRVELGGRAYLADVGFGRQTPTAPLLLEADVQQPTPHEPFRLVRGTRNNLKLQSLVDGEWKSLYHFDERACVLPDYEVANWYVSTHPDSHFTYRLTAGRALPGRRYALLNDRFSVRHVDGRVESRIVASVPELKDVLTQEFGLSVPEDPALDAALARVLSAPKA